MGIALSLAVAWVAPVAGGAVPSRNERVILLHGLARTERSMRPMRKALENAGFPVVNHGYPSRTDTVEHLSDKVINHALQQARSEGMGPIHFVTHSLGGILVRSYLSRHVVPELGRVVMLAPPNRGSELVDAMGDWALFGFVNGPAGRELGTEPESVPNQLGRIRADVGVIAGDRSINWINSLLIPGEDDGKVSVERTKIAGITDHLVIHATHPFIMRNETAIRQTISFLETGKFERDGAVE